jgi:uncharacterized protein involved in response to NO
VFALLGAGVWMVAALGWIPYPASLHRSLMMQGFQQCFVVGFLLTAMPAFTHAARCTGRELAAAFAAVTLVGAAALGGVEPVVHAAFVLSIATVAVAGVRRVAGNAQKPPEEFLFVALGMLLGTLAGLLLLAASLGIVLALPDRFAERLVSLGMMLSIVMGVGSLLVPTFAGLRGPLVIPGVATAHERAGRRPLYAGFVSALLAAFVLELAGLPRAGAILRAATVATMGLWVWKLWRLPRRDVPGWMLWTAGWLLIVGVGMVALWPARAAAGLHVCFLGGFALLTLGVGTRVVVSHGKHPLAIERRVLDGWLLALLAAALFFRLRAEWMPERAAHSLAGSAFFWSVAWGVWAFRALPLLLRPRSPEPRPAGGGTP